LAVASSLENMAAGAPLGAVPEGIPSEPLSASLPLGRAHAWSPLALRIDPVAAEIPQEAASTDMPFTTVFLDLSASR
jgi:hypothetical protein